MTYIIVVGNLIEGVQQAYGPFDDEDAARQWAIGDKGEDRFDNWFSMPLSNPAEMEE